MRLLDVSSFEFIERTNNEPYAILSHTWDEKEFTYGDMIGVQEKVASWSLSDRRGFLENLSQPGVEKVRAACKVAQAGNFQYIWIDTCCIDKNNPTELSRAIRSMFRWYEQAELCIVHIADYPTMNGETPETVFYDKHRWSHRSCPKWFTRGWTLQELLAPTSVAFYDWQWSHIGTKKSLSNEILEVTNIPREALHKERPLSSFSAAQKLSWAARRETKEEEDIAYSLIGIFDVTLPLDYGEGGERAFHRLQRAIIAETDDMSIFGWSMPPVGTSLQSLATYEVSDEESLFAPSPVAFSACSDDEMIVGSGNHRIMAGASKLCVIGTARLRFVRVPNFYNRSQRCARPPEDWRNGPQDGTMRYVVYVSSVRINGEPYSVGLCVNRLTERMFQRDFEAPIIYMKSALASFVELGEYYIAIRKPYPKPSQRVLSIMNKRYKFDIKEAWPPNRWDHCQRQLLEPAYKLHISWIHLTLDIGGLILPLIVLYDHRASSLSAQRIGLINLLEYPQVIRALRRWVPHRRLEEQTWEELYDLAPETRELNNKCHVTQFNTEWIVSLAVADTNILEFAVSSWKKRADVQQQTREGYLTSNLLSCFSYEDALPRPSRPRSPYYSTQDLAYTADPPDLELADRFNLRMLHLSGE